MQTIISIFIAGSKDLKQQRLGLKALANDLNTEYKKQKKDYFIQMYSYENFGDNQDEYNQFIENASELVIFVLEGGIGVHTRDEFRRAAKKYNAEKKPKIKVFLKDYQEKTSGIEEIEKMMEDVLGKGFYYENYSSLDNLCYKAKRTIQDFVDKKSTWRNTFKRIIIGFMIIISALLVMLFWVYLAGQNPTMVFLGGGSAANYLRDFYNYDVRNNDKNSQSLYINMPSSQSFVLIADEVFHNHSIDTNKSNCFYPVFLSATQASESDLLNANVTDENSEFQKRGIVISKKLGIDTLMAYFYVSNSADLFKYKDKTRITSSELESLIKNDTTIKIYTTREGSGTYITYQNCLHYVLDSISSNRKGVYYESTNSNSLCADIKNNNYKSFIILGSNSYTISDFNNFHELNSQSSFSIPLYDLDSIVSKTMYLYFAAYKKDSYYIIPPIMREFLRHILKRNDVTTALELKELNKGETIRGIEDFRFIQDKNGYWWSRLYYNIYGRIKYNQDSNLK